MVDNLGVMTEYLEKGKWASLLIGPLQGQVSQGTDKRLWGYTQASLTKQVEDNRRSRQSQGRQHIESGCIH